MMARNNWEADKMLDSYIYDYMKKKNWLVAAQSFKDEANVIDCPMVVDAPGGFLFEWWAVFWDIFLAKTNEVQSGVGTAAATTYIEAQRTRAREQQQQYLQMQQWQFMQQRRAQLQSRNVNNPGLDATIPAAKMYEERMRHHNSLGFDAINDPRLVVQGNYGGAPVTLQQIQAQTIQTPNISSEMTVAQSSLSKKTLSQYGGIIQSKSGMGSVGLNQGVGLPLQGCPSTGIDQLCQSPSAQVKKPFICTKNEFQLMSPQHQQRILAQAHSQDRLGTLSMFGEMDPRGYGALYRSGLNGKNGQPSGNKGSICSPMRPSSPKFRQDQTEYIMKMQYSLQQSQQHCQQQEQLQQNCRKRKQPATVAPNTTDTEDSVGPPNSELSTSSAHTPGEGVPMGGNSEDVNKTGKGLMIYDTDEAGGLASSSNKTDDLRLEHNVESLLSNDDPGDGRDADPALKRNHVEENTKPSKNFSFREVARIQTSNNKVECCHFSSDGKLLCAGHENKVVVWNMDTFQTESTPEEHSHMITDICFKPNSTHLVTSSCDRTVRLWDAADPSSSWHTYIGHNSPVTSLDFHPKDTDIFCSCDLRGEIRFWSASQYSCRHVSKGASAKVRFQPRTGRLLAAAGENTVTVFDTETNSKILSFQEVNSIRTLCWDTNGDYLASLSYYSLKVWSLASGDCIYSLRSPGKPFYSCVFHPSYSNRVVIGAHESLEVWDIATNKNIIIDAHKGLISDLAQCSVTGMIASASHDKTVALWKSEW